MKVFPHGVYARVGSNGNQTSDRNEGVRFLMQTHEWVDTMKKNYYYISYTFDSILMQMVVKFWSPWYGSHVKDMKSGFWLNVSFFSHVKSAIRAIWLALGFFE